MGGEIYGDGGRVEEVIWKEKVIFEEVEKNRKV